MNSLPPSCPKPLLLLLPAFFKALRVYSFFACSRGCPFESTKLRGEIERKESVEETGESK